MVGLTESKGFDLNFYLNEAERVPALPEETKIRARQTIRIMETNLNSLFPRAINLERKNMAYRLEFLPTPAFFNAYVTSRGHIESDLATPGKPEASLLEMLILQGLCTRDGKRVMVHTTNYDLKSKKVNQMNEDEVVHVGKHEVVHAKAEPRIVHLPSGKTETYKGCKIVVEEKGLVVAIHNFPLQEATTDALVIVGAHSDIRSWDDINWVFQAEEQDGGKDTIYGMRALTQIMKIAFPNFQEGVQFLGDAYFQSLNLPFLIRERIQTLGLPDTNTALNHFVYNSVQNNAELMLKAALALPQKS